VTGLTELIETAVLASTVFAAALTAVTVIDFEVPLAGAVNKPVEEIVPALADHVTAVLLAFPTAAVN
jgi:hypothetical protein